MEDTMKRKSETIMNRTTRKKASKRVACALVIACALVMTAVTPALADENYACKCKGIKQWILFFIPTYGNCGNGFVGGNKDQVTRDISGAALSSYIPPGVSGQITTGSQCGYYQNSGWNCGKMSGSSLPQCLND